MSRVTTAGLATALLALSGSGWAQSQPWELSAAAGYTPSASLTRQASELSGLDVRGGLTWDVRLARSFGPRWVAEISWAQQSSALQLETDDGSADLFEMGVAQLHGNAVYQFGTADSRLRPFLFAGLGATFLSGRDLQSETKFSFGFGGGVKYFPWKTLGLRAQIGYKPTLLKDDGAGDYCDPFGFCQGTLHQFELGAGVIVRF
jgi:opacity protein-like surface antigen